MAYTETRVLSAHVPLTLAKKVELLAIRLERSRDWILRQALTAWVDQEDERNRLTYEALADVESDRSLDHRAMQEWAESLGTEHPLAIPV